MFVLKKSDIKRRHIQLDTDQEDPLFCRRHLRTSLRLALRLQSHCQPVELHGELPEVLVLPNALVLRLGGGQDHVDVAHVSPETVAHLFFKTLPIFQNGLCWLLHEKETKPLHELNYLFHHLIVCWMYCWTARVESISSNFSSGQLLKSSARVPTKGRIM